MRCMEPNSTNNSLCRPSPIRRSIRFTCARKWPIPPVRCRDARGRYTQRFLYLVRENGRALRYGVGIGRDGFAWSGRAIVQWKQEWPKWTPPASMIARQPELERWSAANGGMPPGLDNPLGARALYIFQNGVDTLYRVHGSPEYKSIGKAVSSGCVRLINQDVCDLYDRVPTRTPILVV
jgi:lipoprotein-anchoring transpeptidase ErfK/SrfK